MALPMKKVGILNFQYSNHNYGAVLQAAALEYICRNLGYDVRHLNYIPKKKISLKGRVGQLLRKLGLRRTWKASRIENLEAFEKFRQAHINRTKLIQSTKDFRAVAKSFDSVVVGSDQVWRPEFARDTTTFFLKYVPKGIHRIAYAASFGTETWEQKSDIVLTKKVSEELQKFKAISCREESGVAICKEVFGVDATHVLDPLLVVDELFIEKIAEKSSIKSAAKLIYYKLDPDPGFQEDLKVIGSRFGCDAINIYVTDSRYHEYREVADWLALILNAEVIVTDSYHCICLGLRFGKEVIFSPNKKRGQTRLDSLFKMLNVGTEPVSLDLNSMMFKLSVKEDVKIRLEKECANSIKFLRSALKG